MFADVMRERLDIVMDEGMLQLRRLSLDHDVLVDFHVGHGCVLIFQTALERPFPRRKSESL